MFYPTAIIYEMQNVSSLAKDVRRAGRDGSSVDLQLSYRSKTIAKLLLTSWIYDLGASVADGCNVS